MFKLCNILGLSLVISACGGKNSEQIPTLEFEDEPPTIWTSHPETESAPPDFCQRAERVFGALPAAKDYRCQEANGADAAFVAVVETRGVGVMLIQGTEDPWVLFGFEYEENARSNMGPEDFEELERAIVLALES